MEVDETMIRQALVNLLANAARHDPGPLEVRAARGVEMGRRLQRSEAERERSGSVGRTPGLRDAAAA
jgi:signal transduction histidine kinase